MVMEKQLFIMLLTFLASELKAECIGIKSFQTCTDKNGSILSVIETGSTHTFPEAFKEDSDWQKTIGALRTHSQIKLNNKKSSPSEKMRDNQSNLEINSPICVLGPLGNAC
jgi:hypothetical protein